LAIDPILGRHSPFLLFPIAILLAARFGGWLPALVATILSAVGGWYFFINPPFSFVIADKGDAEDLAVYVISATGISLLGGQLRESLISKTKSEQAAKMSEQAAKQSESTVRALLDRLINAQEQERRRISRELHDDLNQKIALLAFDTGGLLAMRFSSQDKIREQLSDVQTRIVELSEHVREISHKLHPSILEDLGLIAALNQLCEDFSAREGIKVMFTSEGARQAIPVEAAACLYRVAQEAMHNILKHARADYVRMSLSGDSRGIHLSIHDTGVGFDSEAGLGRPGLGIVSMKERVLMVHGDFSIHSQPGQGTEVRVFVPLPRESLCPP
jgi:signal transduction histidine kinase